MHDWEFIMLIEIFTEDRTDILNFALIYHQSYCHDCSLIILK